MTHISGVTYLPLLTPESREGYITSGEEKEREYEEKIYSWHRHEYIEWGKNGKRKILPECDIYDKRAPRIGILATLSHFLIYSFWDRSYARICCEGGKFHKFTIHSRVCFQNIHSVLIPPIMYWI
jgi:hypothetical protein